MIKCECGEVVSEDYNDCPVCRKEVKEVDEYDYTESGKMGG